LSLQRRRSPVIPAGTDVRPLTRVDGAHVSVLPLKMGEFTIYGSMPGLRTPAAGGQLSITALLGLAEGKTETDSSGYYRVSRPPAPGAPVPPMSGAQWQAWPWRPELNPLIFLAHSFKDEICLVQGERTWLVPDRVLGSQARLQAARNGPVGAGAGVAGD
jgi:hypothetical protein